MTDLLEMMEGEERRANPASWKMLAFDHLFWLVSRALLGVLIVSAALAFRVSFERLITGEAVHEMVQRETKKRIDQFDFLEALSVSASRFDSAFADSTEATLAFERDPRTASRELALAKLHIAQEQWSQLKRQFEGRTALLDDNIESTTRNLLADGETGLRNETDVLSQQGAKQTVGAITTFSSSKTLLHQETKRIDQLERNFVKGNIYGS